jgi:modulator of FtsH protease
VTPAYAAPAWVGFATAVAAAAATLTGLLFVAVSINLQRILQYPNLPGRAAQTLVMFSTPLVFSIFMLVPGQPAAVLAGELIGTGIVIGAGLLVIDARAGQSVHETRHSWLLSRIFPAITSCVCLVVAGATLLPQAGGGLYWLLPAALVAIVAGLANTWVLLIEILR